MNDNHASLTRVYTALTDSIVEENAPNQPDVGESPDADFDLFVEAAAGNNIGSSSTPYTLTITGVNVTKQAVVPQLTSVSAQAFNAANGWNSSGDDFVKTQRLTFNLPLPRTRQTTSTASTSPSSPPTSRARPSLKARSSSCSDRSAARAGGGLVPPPSAGHGASIRSCSSVRPLR